MQKLPTHDLVLLGVGHTNAHLLRMWRMRPIADCRLTCLSDFPVATYSGMLPGVLAGDYPPDRMEIDLVRLCAAAGARLVLDPVVGLDQQARTLLFERRPPLPFDVLSIGIGSTPSMSDLGASSPLVTPIKPMQTFLRRLQNKCAEVLAQRPDRPIRIVVVGGGAGGVEICFCLPGLAKRMAEQPTLQISLVHGGKEVAPGSSAGLQQEVEAEFKKQGVTLLRNRRATGIENEDSQLRLQIDQGDDITADVVIWATGAVASPLLGDLGLPTDDRGFLLVDEHLRSTAGGPIFAVGDSGSRVTDPTPKAGVYAVRQAPILWDNVQRTLKGEPLKPYVPQRGFLKILNTGDQRGILEYKGFSFQGGWCWKLKDAIDTRFMDKYQDYEPASMGDAAVEPAPMRCVGCGGKISGTVLSKALARIDSPATANLEWGHGGSDDAAMIRAASGRVVATHDFFAAPLDDPYLVGRIAAQHAASDLFASGAQPTAALAAAELPLGSPTQQEQLLYETLSGAAEELAKMNAALAGGHTIEGPRFTLGFTMLGELRGEHPIAKSALQVGDRLILTKPLGSGVLLMALASARCQGDWLPPLLAAMLQSNQGAADVVHAMNLRAATDVTGFGLAGHLLEMLEASECSAELQLDSIKLLPGAKQLFGERLESTLAPSNRDAIARMETTIPHDSPQFSALFDPQTSGGLLIASPEDQAKEVLQRLADQGYEQATIIGSVIEKSGQPTIRAT